MPTITYNLAPNPIWQFTNFAALFAAGCKMYTYRDIARNTPKPVFTDPSGLIPWSNPLIFSDPDGSAYPIYWASDENYFVQIYDANDNLLYTFTQFNAPGFVGSTEPGLPPIKNYVVDGQFRFPISPSFSNIQRGTWIAPKWLFTKMSPSTSTDNLTFSQFPLGQTLVPSNPVNSINLTCTIPGSDTEKAICHFFDDVNMFETNTITISFWAMSSFSSTIYISLKQFFGTGGSGAIVTNLPAINLTTSWAVYSVSILVPSTAGNTRGTNNDDSLEVFFNLPLNSAYNLAMTNVQIQLGNVATPYDFNGYNLERSKSFGQKLPIPAAGNPSPDQGKYVTLGTETSGGVSGEPAFVLTSLPLYTGMIMSVYANPPGSYPGWAAANGTFLNSYTNNLEAYNLYSLLKNNEINGSSPVIIGTDGFITTTIDGGLNCQVTGEENGLCTNAADFNTGLVISTPSEGTLSSAQITQINGAPASSLMPGTYFYINSVTYQYYCYITINGIGNDPKIVGYTGIPIHLTSGMTTAQVASVLAFQIGGAVYATPDLTGYFPRFGPTNPSSIRDPDYLTRTGGNAVTSAQTSAVIQHTHTYELPTPSTNVVQSGADTPFFSNVNTQTSGVNGTSLISTGETRSINVYLFPLIKL